MSLAVVGGEASKNQVLNDKTYQEVEYLKKNLGPILIAALAEICIRRPADPIEFLGHWLLRWRYNEELKRRDVQNALEVVRQKTWKDDANPQPLTQGSFTQGFTPETPFSPAGYGGPLDAGSFAEPGEGGEDEEGAEKRASGVSAAGSEARRASGEGISEGEGEVMKPPSGEVGGARPSAMAIVPLEESTDAGEDEAAKRRSSQKSAALSRGPSAGETRGSAVGSPQPESEMNIEPPEVD